MNRATFAYGAVLATAAFGLQWLDYKHATRVFATEIYVGIVALAFAALGLWAGLRLTRPTNGRESDINFKAIDALGISRRELEVLQLLSCGHSNREIAEKLFVSPNTVKTHLSRLYEKLEVSRRTQAVARAKALRLVI